MFILVLFPVLVVTKTLFWGKVGKHFKGFYDRI